MQTQVRLQKDVHLVKPYSLGPYNKVKGCKQAIRITEGCPHNCPQCNEPREFKIFGIPEIEKPGVLVFDMNLLAKTDHALGFIRHLGETKTKGKHSKFIRWELVCGLDYRFLTQELADALYQSHCWGVGFDQSIPKGKVIRLAWDHQYQDQFLIKKAVDMLVKAGFKRNEIMLFIQANYREVSFQECLMKLDLCKVWGVKVCDCYYDGQVMPHVIPIYWTAQEIKTFRAKCRKHNQLVNFGFDPQLSKNPRYYSSVLRKETEKRP